LNFSITVSIWQARSQSALIRISDCNGNVTVVIRYTVPNERAWLFRWLFQTAIPLVVGREYCELVRSVSYLKNLVCRIHWLFFPNKLPAFPFHLHRSKALLIAHCVLPISLCRWKHGQRQLTKTRRRGADCMIVRHPLLHCSLQLEPFKDGPQPIFASFQESCIRTGSPYLLSWTQRRGVSNPELHLSNGWGGSGIGATK
jgi:hypothetical protein